MESNGCFIFPPTPPPKTEPTMVLAWVPLRRGAPGPRCRGIAWCSLRCAQAPKVCSPGRASSPLLPCPFAPAGAAAWLRAAVGPCGPCPSFIRTRNGPAQKAAVPFRAGLARSRARRLCARRGSLRALALAHGLQGVGAGCALVGLRALALSPLRPCRRPWPLAPLGAAPLLLPPPFFALPLLPPGPPRGFVGPMAPSPCGLPLCGGLRSLSVRWWGCGPGKRNAPGGKPPGACGTLWG